MNKLSKEYLESKIQSKEYTSFKTIGGQMLRWCILTMQNGFAIVGEPSCCVDPINDNEEIGNKIAYDNSFEKLWSLEGYLLKEKLSNQKDNK